MESCLTSPRAGKVKRQALDFIHERSYSTTRVIQLAPSRCVGAGWHLATQEERSTKHINTCCWLLKHCDCSRSSTNAPYRNVSEHNSSFLRRCLPRCEFSNGSPSDFLRLFAALDIYQNFECCYTRLRQRGMKI